MKKEESKYPFENLKKFIHEFVEENSYKIPELKWMSDTEFEVYTSKLEFEILKKFQDSKLRYYVKREGIENETEEYMKKDILEILGTIDYRFLKDFEFATPKLNRDARIIELNNTIAQMESYLAQNKDNKFYQEMERPKLEELKKELEKLNKDFISETLFKIRIGQIVREEIQRQINISKNFEYESEVSKDSIINLKSDECKAMIFNKFIEKKEIIKLYANNIKTFDSLLIKEIRTLLPQLDKRFTSIVSPIKNENIYKEESQTPEEFVKNKLDSSPDKIVLTEKIEKTKENKYFQSITVYIKGDEKVGSNFPFETQEQYENRKKVGFITVDNFESMMTPAWERKELTLKINESNLDYCKRLNDLSFIKIQNALVDWKDKVDSQSKSEWINYFENVEGYFNDWYFKNGYETQTDGQNIMKEESEDSKKNNNLNSSNLLEKTQAKVIKEDEQREIELLNNQLRVAHNQVQRLNKIKFSKIDYSKYSYSIVSKAVDKTRKKNGKLNYSAIAKELSILSHHTAKKICDYHNIK